ncbi:response regulator [Anaeromyxobacter oryzisoli]|uniref:response regulator n=1 Tax=Anaeromyxobacter oryzisoli TaxID=2925408 RepID=UPI001F589F84|nr:response regulator [Anaeromyxobacter sp. SG63]
MASDSTYGDPAIGSDERPIRVLLVEDDRDLRGALSDLLRLEHLDVVEARDGLEALHLLRSGEPAPDVILLDLVLPILSGRELRQVQLEDPALAGIPVVLLSSWPLDVLADVPAAAALTKPCRPARLLETLARVARPRR